MADKEVRIFSRDEHGDDSEIVVINAGHLQEIIEDWERKAPKDKRSKLFKQWQDKLSLLYSTYNDLVGFKAYPVNKQKPLK